MLMKLQDEGMGETPDENRNILKTSIIPSIEMLARMEVEGVVRGGFFEGQRSAAFMMAVPSEEALDKVLAELPCADIFGIEAIPLEGLREALERDRAALKKLQ